ncbi:helix-turn-helix domain-containing protein [Streptomyces sp. NBC_01465]|uniref:helix-turn-helix domain-containing protein n=1 Tax=Streptomyces sp. NBC_01465 TaxID=2903878 RepID=UPI002E32FF5E|nr:helix-turn-helix domain-containing protein [Streptomyces sp. NBC_01465]
MTDFDALDALLASVRLEAALPPAAERRLLREGLGLAQAQVAEALGVSPSTVRGWEAGREPAGEIRTKYAYLLDGLRAKLHPENEQTAEDSDGEGDIEGDGAEDVELAVAAPCVLCGQPARHQVEGFPQHLTPEECAEAAPPQSTPAPADTPRPEPRAHTPKTPPTQARRALQESSDMPDLIGQAVQAAMEKAQGDMEAASAALLKRAIPDAMSLLDACRKGARYDIVAHPWVPDVLKKKTARGADEIWEARPKWTRAELPPGAHEITALDINGAYLSALKTHLPLGSLEHSSGDTHDRRRAGIHLITPAAWEYEDVLPNPIGNRDEPGPLWITEPTLRLLLRLSGTKYRLCEPPVIHESFTSGATENLLEKFRGTLRDARERAIAEDDEVTLEYVKAMYSKFVSTMGESNYNRELYRPDWMHIIRSQAFANLWTKAFKAHNENLTVVRAMGTDELHLLGDWRRVFPEGRGVAEVKVKDVYTVGGDTGS